MVIKNVIVCLGMLFILTSCLNEELSDAYGQFEATEIIVSAETSGKLLWFDAEEGVRLQKNMKVGQTDTLKLSLKKKELAAQLESVRVKKDHIDAQSDVVKERLNTAKIELNRIKALMSDRAATQQKLDDAEGRVRALEKEIIALQIQKNGIEADSKVINAKIDQVSVQIDDSEIVNPVEGIVLTKFSEPNELVQPGMPLYEIASLDTLILRIYVSGARLPDVQLGNRVDVFVDKNRKENRKTDGWISWISSEAEFTPKMIQTKEERVTQVYAVKVRVPNPDGILKIGMPGEVNF